MASAANVNLTTVKRGDTYVVNFFFTDTNGSKDISHVSIAAHAKRAIDGEIWFDLNPVKVNAAEGHFRIHLTREQTRQITESPPGSFSGIYDIQFSWPGADEVFVATIVEGSISISKDITIVNEDLQPGGDGSITAGSLDIELSGSLNPGDFAYDDKMTVEQITQNRYAIGGAVGLGGIDWAVQAAISAAYAKQYKDETKAFRDETEEFRDETEEFRDETKAFRDETKGFRNQASQSKAIAVNAASTATEAAELAAALTELDTFKQYRDESAQSAFEAAENNNQSLANKEASEQAASSALDYRNQAKGYSQTATTKASEASSSAQSAELSEQAAKESEDKSKESELTSKQNADKSHEDRTAVEDLAQTVANQAEQVASDAEQIALDVQRVSEIKSSVSQDKQVVVDLADQVDADASSVRVALNQVNDQAEGVNTKHSEVVTKHNEVMAKHSDVIEKANEVASNTATVATLAESAAESEAVAVESAELAQRFANEEEDTEIADSLFSAKHWAKKAEKVKSELLKNNGIWTPTESVEYPTPVSENMDEQWIIGFSDSAGEYTFLTGDLANKTVRNTDLLYFSRKSLAFSFIPSPSANAVLSVNSKSGSSIMLGSGDIPHLDSEDMPTTVRAALISNRSLTKQKLGKDENAVSANQLKNDLTIKITGHVKGEAKFNGSEEEVTLNTQRTESIKISEVDNLAEVLENSAKREANLSDLKSKEDARVNLNVYSKEQVDEELDKKVDSLSLETTASTFTYEDGKITQQVIEHGDGQETVTYTYENSMLTQSVSVRGGITKTTTYTYTDGQLVGVTTV